MGFLIILIQDTVVRFLVKYIPQFVLVLTPLFLLFPIGLDKTKDDPKLQKDLHTLVISKRTSE